MCPHIVGTYEWSKSRDGKAEVGKGGGEERNFLASVAFSSTTAQRLCSFVSTRKGPEEYSILIAVETVPAACSPFNRGRILLFSIIQNERNKKHLSFFLSVSVNDAKFVIRSALYYSFACKSHTALFRSAALQLGCHPLLVVKTLFAPELDVAAVCNVMERILSGKLFFFYDSADEFGLVYRPAGGVMVDV
jgi:hypothetical protein